MVEGDIDLKKKQDCDVKDRGQLPNGCGSKELELKKIVGGSLKNPPDVEKGAVGKADFEEAIVLTGYGR